MDISPADLVLVLRLLTARWGPPATTRASLDRLVSIALVHRCWRNTPLEDWHASGNDASPTDFDMFRANVRLTRELLRAIERHELDVPQLTKLVTDPLRLALPDRTASVFCGPSWALVQEHAYCVVETLGELLTELGEHSVRLLYAAETLTFGSSWWGTPDFEERLRASINRHAPQIRGAELEGAIARPETMSEALFHQVLYGQL